jgi:quinol monooxygenase YgiN
MLKSGSHTAAALVCIQPGESFLKKRRVAMGKVRVFAHVKAKAGKEQEMREQLLELVRASRAEDGVDFYDLHETTDGGEFLFSEQYAGQLEFDQHKASDHFKQAGEAMVPLLDGDLTIWVVDPVDPVD